MRQEYPHSLSYQATTFTMRSFSTIVERVSTMAEWGFPLKSIETRGRSHTSRIPRSGPLDASRKAVLTSSIITSRSSSATRSMTETGGVGTRKAIPLKRPASCGITLTRVPAAPGAGGGVVVEFGGERTIGDNPVQRRIVLALVHAKDNGEVLVLRRGRDQNTLRPRSKVLLSFRAPRPTPAAFQDDLRAHIRPVQLGPIAFPEDHKPLSVHPQGALFALDLGGEGSVVGVELEQQRVGVCAGRIVDGDQLKGQLLLPRGAKRQPTDPSEPVDSDPHHHLFLLDTGHTVSRGRLPSLPRL